MAFNIINKLMSLKPYCGIGKIPKKHTLGSMIDCCEAGQVRLCGIRKIDPILLNAIQKGTVKPESRSKLLEAYILLDTMIKKKKNELNAAEDVKTKSAIEKSITKMIKEIKGISKDLKKVNAVIAKQKDKENEAKKQKDASNNDTDSSNQQETKPKKKIVKKTTKSESDDSTSDSDDSSE